MSDLSLDCFGGPGGGNPPRIQRLRRRCSRALWSVKGMAEHKRRHGHPLQPKMFSSCDALPYHWIPTSMAERVGLPPCNGSTTLNNLPHRFFCATHLPSSSRSRDHHDVDLGLALLHCHMSVHILLHCVSLHVLFHCMSVHVLFHCMSVHVLFHCMSVHVLLH